MMIALTREPLFRGLIADPAGAGKRARFATGVPLVTWLAAVTGLAFLHGRPFKIMGYGVPVVRATVAAQLGAMTPTAQHKARVVRVTSGPP